MNHGKMRLRNQYWPQRVLPWGSGNAVSRNWCCLNRSAGKKQEWGKAGWRWSLDKILGCADTGREGQNQRDGKKTRQIGSENTVLSVHWFDFGIWGKAKCGDTICGVPHPKIKAQLRDGDSRGHCPSSAPCPDMSGSPFQVNNEHFISSLSLNMKKILFF